METCMYDPSYAEKIDQEYYTNKCLNKQKEVLLKHPDVLTKTIISRGPPALGILIACREHDPDLIILEKGNKRHNIFDLFDDRWNMVRKKCAKPLLEVNGSQPK